MSTPSFTDQITKEVLNRVRAPLESAWTLPPVAYTHADSFAAEKAHIFSRDWQCIAREEQVLNAGDFLSFDFLDQPMVLTRDTNHQLHAISRVCLHRAMPLVSGSGNTKRLVCPYHLWSYELDGQLRNAPLMGAQLVASDTPKIKGFDPAQCKLPSFELEVWQGFVFVKPRTEGPAATPVAEQLTGLQHLIQDYHFDDLVVADTIEFDSPWNWKLLVENFMEAYHHIGPHKGTLQLQYPARKSSVPDNSGQPWAFLNMPSDTPHADDGITSFPHVPAQIRQNLFAAAVFPHMLIAASSTAAAWYQLTPTAHDKMNLKIHILLHPTLRDAMNEEQLSQVRAAFTAIHLEDIPVNEGPWQGLQAGLTTQGRLSPLEKAIWQLNQYWLDRLGF